MNLWKQFKSSLPLVSTTSLEEKLARLRQLEKIQYPSDQEIEETHKLREDIQLIYLEGIKPVLDHTKEVSPPEKKRKRTIFEVIQEYRKKRNQEKAATVEEIKQLRLDLARAELQRDIADAKAASRKNKKNGWEIMRSVLGSNNIQTAPTNRRTKKPQEPRDNLDKVYDKILGDNPSSKDVKDTFW